MHEDHYYEAPPQAAFDDMKAKAIKLWQTYDNTYGYVDEKVNAIKDLKNVGDNFMYILAMFDIFNMQKIIKSLKESTKDEVHSRMVVGGADNYILEAMGLI